MTTDYYLNLYFALSLCLYTRIYTATKHTRAKFYPVLLLALTFRRKEILLSGACTIWLAV